MPVVHALFRLARANPIIGLVAIVAVMIVAEIFIRAGALALSYQETVAEIVETKDRCTLEKTERRRRYYSDPMPCELAEAARRTPGQWQGFVVVRERTVQLAYALPSTGEIVRGEYQAGRVKPEDYTVGKRLMIHAHSTDPGVIEKMLGAEPF